MEGLGTDSGKMNENTSSTTYNLVLQNVFEVTSPTGELESLEAGGGDLNEDSKDLPLLIIQERLDEPATAPETEAVTVNDSFAEEMTTATSERQESEVDTNLLALNNTDTASKETTRESNGNKEPKNEQQSEEHVQYSGYLVYNAVDHTLKVTSSKVTPLLELANNLQKGMYEAKVVLQESIETNPTVNNDQDSQGVQNGTNNPTKNVTINDPNADSVTVEGETKFEFKGKQTSGHLLYMCDTDQCGAAFRSLEEFHRHQVSHAMSQEGVYKSSDYQGVPNRNLLCSFEGCNRTFTWPTHLKYHELTHTGKRKFVCEHEGCGASFFTAQRLLVHNRIHTGEKPYVCPEPKCGKSFTTHGNLKNHVRVHSGEKPFVCGYNGCNKRFAEHSSLRKHMLVHTGMKPYECELCGKKFSQSGSRNVHMKRHQVLSMESDKSSDRQIAVETAESNSTSIMVKLPNDQVVILQQSHGELLQGYQEVNASESIVFSNAVTDHVVTVTTQPAEVETTLQQGISKHEEIGPNNRQSHSSLTNSTMGANVVVLSQPEEMVTMTRGYHHEGEENSKDMGYTCQQLLNVDVS